MFDLSSVLFIVCIFLLLGFKDALVFVSLKKDSVENDWKIVCRKNSIVSKEKQQIIRSFASLNDIITIFHI